MQSEFNTSTFDAKNKQVGAINNGSIDRSEFLTQRTHQQFRHSMINTGASPLVDWGGHVHPTFARYLTLMQIQCPVSFLWGGVYPRMSLNPKTPITGLRSALAMCVHPTFFDLAAPLDKTRENLLLQMYTGRKFLSISDKYYSFITVVVVVCV